MEDIGLDNIMIPRKIMPLIQTEQKREGEGYTHEWISGSIDDDARTG